ncbi:MAG TPA: hypothetical protein VIK89_09445 [Cytophagaceae bacterium]
MQNKLCLIVLILVSISASCFSNHSGPLGFKTIKDLGRQRVNKLKGVKKDTMLYRLPFLTFHLGASLAFTDGTMQVNPAGNGLSGSKIGFEEDLDFKDVKIFPRVNAYIRFGHRLLFIFDVYTIRRKEINTLAREIQFGNTAFQKGTRVDSRFLLVSSVLAYRYSLITRPHFDIGAIIGGTGIYYRLKIEEDNESALQNEESVFLPVPIIGLDGMTFINKNLYLRGVVKFSYSPINNYEYLIWSVRPYLEYYIWENIGVGLKYHFSYNHIRELSKDKFNGNFKFEFHAISLVATWRIM